MADNIPFASAELNRFAQGWGFHIITSSPTYAQSNGQAERTIRTVKQGLRKALESREDLDLTLLTYRNSPIARLPYSPAQLLMNRRLRDRLPMTERILQPHIPADARQLLVRRQQVAKKFFDRNSKELPPHIPGESVRIKQENVWGPAVVTAIHHSFTPFISCDDAR